VFIIRCGEQLKQRDSEDHVVKADDLVVGNTYFMVTYPDPGMSAPIVITYRYLGRDPEGVEEDEPGPHCYFRYLPAFQYEADEEALRSTSAWSEYFPRDFPDGVRAHQHHFRRRSWLGLNRSTA
jgi:hypothetical protein